MRYFQTLYNISFDDVIFDSTQEVAKRYDFKDAPSMKMVLSVIRRDFLILLTTRGRRSVTLPQCDMTTRWMTVPLASVNSLPISLNVDTCGSDTEDVSDPSDGCGFSNIWLRMSDLEAAISGLNAIKEMRRPPGYSVGAFALYFILLYAEDLKIFFPVARNIDFANAQAELDVFFPVVHRQPDAAQLRKV
jgi:hypothetical protein